MAVLGLVGGSVLDIYSEAELVAHARTLLAAYKCPKQVFALAALPRNQLGKLNRAALTATAGHPPDPRPL